MPVFPARLVSRYQPDRNNGDLHFMVPNFALTAAEFALIAADYINKLFSLPAQRPTRLILNHARLEEVFLFLQIDQL
jgi:hypothetical protein